MLHLESDPRMLKTMPQKLFLFLLLFVMMVQSIYAEHILNIYAWGGEIPKFIILEFEKETGIHVHFSTYDSNEIMFAKLKSSHKSIYDLIIPSAYFVERMRHQGMLIPIDHHQLSNYQNIAENFLNHTYDPHNRYSIPYIWGTTGIFYNKRFIKQPIHHWRQLWDTHWTEQLMLLDDSREIFAIALMKLGYSPNDENPDHIKNAYLALMALRPNIKLFATEGIQATVIDEDAHIGVIWNSDALKAQRENPNIHYVYPKEGFVIWIDCLAIPKNAPHIQEAYKFINFLLRADISKQISLREDVALTNQAAFNELPTYMRENKILYPTKSQLKQSTYQHNLSQTSMNLYNQYWQQFKLSV